MNGSLGLFGTSPSSAKRLGQAFRSRTCDAASRGVGRPMPVNRSNARLAVSLAYTVSPHGGLAVALGRPLGSDSLPGGPDNRPAHYARTGSRRLAFLIADVSGTLGLRSRGRFLILPPTLYRIAPRP